MNPSTIKTTRVLLAPNELLARRIAADVTVEAEYGNSVVEGRLYTAAHHQPPGSPWAGRHEGGCMPSPCNDSRIPVAPEHGIVLLSHIDLDSIGGALRAMGWNRLFADDSDDNARREFWHLAEFVDVRGSHRLAEWSGTDAAVHAWYAFQAARKSDPASHPIDTVSNVTLAILQSGERLERILRGDAALLADGLALLESQRDLNNRTFVDLLVTGKRTIIARKAQSSRDACNHLYTSPDGRIADAVVTLNAERGSVTISLAVPITGLSCRAFVQKFWGPGAGGHDGIAASPRGVRFGDAQWKKSLAELSTLMASC